MREVQGEGEAGALTDHVDLKWTKRHEWALIKRPGGGARQREGGNVCVTFTVFGGAVGRGGGVSAWAEHM